MRIRWGDIGRTIQWKLILWGPATVATVVICLLFMALVPFNGTPSMPYGWYVRLPAKNIRVGDLVEIDNPFRGLYGVTAEHGLVKRVSSIEGDLYELRGEHSLSYDSRFFGLIGEEYIRHRLIPLATFTEVPGWMQWLIRNFEDQET